MNETNTQTRTPSVLFGANELITVAKPTKEIAVANLEIIPQNTMAIDLAKKNSIITTDAQTLILFGSERQKQIGAALDGLLAEITKESSPVLFELFKQLQKGVNEANLPQLESEIRESLKTKWYHKVLDSLKLSNAAKRIQSANESIGELLSGKSKNLLSLTQNMEKQIGAESLKLIENSKRLETLAQEYRTNINEFGTYVQAGQEILKDGKEQLVIKQESAKTDLEIEGAKLLEQKVQLFENRQLVLETILTQAPAELESIRLSQGAGLSTLAETVNSSSQEFSEIKSSLIKICAAFQIQTVQSLNNERRKLRDSLNNYGNDLLENVSIAAARQAGENRIQDANKLLDTATRLNAISAKVIEEKKNNELRFAEARVKLGKVKELINS